MKYKISDRVEIFDDDGNLLSKILPTATDYWWKSAFTDFLYFPQLLQIIELGYEFEVIFLKGKMTTIHIINDNVLVTLSYTDGNSYKLNASVYSKGQVFKKAHHFRKYSIKTLLNVLRMFADYSGK